MKSKIIILISLLLLIACSLSCVAAQNADNETQEIQTETLAAFDNDNLTAGEGTFSDLQTVINDAEEESTVTLDRDYKGSVNTYVQLHKTLTVDGAGHTIDCDGQYRCFALYSKSGDITLKNLIIKNGKNHWFQTGGAIYIDGTAKYTIINCTFENNWAHDSGGAIYNAVKDESLTIKDCKFIKNSVSLVNGGAIYSKGDVSIENSYFESNVVLYDGGAIYSLGSVEASNSSFISNKASESSSKCYGGAICAKGDVIVEECEFKNNSADNAGGAIYAYKDLIAVDSTFAQNSAYEGGAIYTDGSRAIIGGSVFDRNSAKSGHGGAVYADKYCLIDNSNFTSNSATGRGGAVYTDIIQFAGESFFINNTAGGHGGAVYTGMANNVSSLSFQENHADSDGGAVYINSKSGDVYFSNCNFSKNTADADGGAIYSDSKSTDIYLDGCNFTENSAKKLGGAIYSCILKSIGDCIFISNSANEGGAVYINNKCQISIKNTYFEENNANNGRGGAVYIDSSSSTLNVNHNAFISNKATGDGKDIFNSGKYTASNSNWWGSNNPSFEKRMVEGHVIGSNENIKDIFPVEISITGPASGYTFENIQLTFSFDSEVPGYLFDLINLTSDVNVSIADKTISGNLLKFNIITGEIGNHTVTAKLNSQTLTFDLNVVKNTVTGNDIVKYYGDNNLYSATFFDAKGNYLSNGSPVTFQIGSDKYIEQVSTNGSATLEINLDPGIYTVKAINKLTGDSYTNRITVLSRNLTYNINDTFIMKFVSDESLNNEVATFTLAGKTYQCNITNSIAYLRLDVEPGNYELEITYKNNVIKNNITVLNQYSILDLNLTLTDNYGSLIPIYSNETFTRVGNTMYSVLGENTYRYIMPDRKAFILYNVTASNSSELTKILKTISSSDFKADIITINLNQTTYKVTDNFWRDQEWYYLIHLSHGKLYINGNGATIDDEYHHNFMALNAGTNAVINNVTFKRFYRCFLNNGDIYCLNCTFVENNPKFWATDTPGAVIHNKNTVTFENCVFDHNENDKDSKEEYHEYLGGVLYADEKSVNTFIKCSFKSKTDNVRALADSLIVIYDVDYGSYFDILRNGYLDRNSGIDIRGMDSLQSNRTTTFNLTSSSSIIKFAHNNLINDIFHDSRGYVVNLENKIYNFTDSDLDSLASDSREWRTIFIASRYGAGMVHERYLLEIGSRPVVINGHGATINLTGNGYSDDYSFAYVPFKCSLTLVNLTIAGFNTAVVNRGILTVINCTFTDNVIHHLKVENDYGGAIRNYGNVYCYNSTFTNNAATRGGAVYAAGSTSNAVFFNCSFSGNVYKSNWLWKNNDPNIFYVDNEAVVKLIGCEGIKNTDIKTDHDGLVLYRDNLTNNVYSAEIDSVAGLYRLSKMVSDNEDYDVFNITIAEGDYNLLPDSQVLFEMDYGTLIIHGYGARIFVQNPKKNDETQFATLSARSALVIYGLTVEGFNIAIANEGKLEIYNSQFLKNQVDYKSKDDYGGAIVNLNNLKVFNTTFADNYAKYGGAVYNKGTSSFIMCNYSDNIGYSKNSKVDIYNFDGAVENIIIGGNSPSMVENHPRSSWRTDLIETGFFLLINAVTSGVSYGITALDLAAAQFISNAAVLVIGGGFGALHGWIYSADLQDYSGFWVKVLQGISAALDAKYLGEAAFELARTPDDELAQYAMETLIDEIFSRTIDLGQNFAETYEDGGNYEEIALYWFFNS